MSTVKTLLPLKPSDLEIETSYNNQVPEVTQPEAEAGTSTDVKRWTPERVRQAINALSSSGASITFDTKANILNSAPTSDRLAYATDVNRFYIADGTNWNESPIGFSPRSQGKTDRGPIKNSPLSGYGKGFITNKTLHNVIVLDNMFEEFGAVRSTTDPGSGVQVFQVYLNSRWNTVPIDITFLPVDANYVHNVANTIIEIHSGNSIDRGLNGQTFVQQYKRSRGAMPYSREINGNI